MKGLLVKDLRLMKNQRQFFLSILVIALVFALAGQPALGIVLKGGACRRVFYIEHDQL